MGESRRALVTERAVAFEHAAVCCEQELERVGVGRDCGKYDAGSLGGAGDDDRQRQFGDLALAAARRTNDALNHVRKLAWGQMSEERLDGLNTTTQKLLVERHNT